MQNSLKLKKLLHQSILITINDANQKIKWAKFSLTAPKKLTSPQLTEYRKGILVELLKDLSKLAFLEYQLRIDIDSLETKQALLAMGTRFTSNGRAFYLLP